MAEYTPQHPKPYELIDFASRTPHRTAVIGHDQFHADRHSGYLELLIIVRTNLQVASGAYDVRGDNEIAALETRVGRYTNDTGQMKQSPVIPGSSLKGMVRSLVEIISPSCLTTVTKQWARHIPAGLTACTEIAALCPACRLFGMTGAEQDNYLGQLSFEDARLLDGQRAYISTPQLWASKGLPPRYLNKNAFKGRKVYHHSQVAKGNDTRLTFHPGATLLTKIHFENLQTAELGLCLAALGLHPSQRFLPKLGAGKPVGMGSIEIHPKTIKLRGDLRRNGRLGGRGSGARDADKLQALIRAWTNAADKDTQLLQQNNLFTLADILQPNNLKRPPVTGTY